MSTVPSRLAAAALLCVVCFGAGGCLLISDSSNEARSPTLGRELRDLKVARDEGAIAPEEYDTARQKLLARLDKPRGT